MAISIAPPSSIGLADLLAHHADHRPDRPFLRTGTSVLDYGPAHAKIDAFAAGLQRAGVAVGDRVVLVMDNSVEQVLIWLAVNRMGAVNVPLNAALSPELLARAIALVQPRCFVADRQYADNLATSAVMAECVGRPLYVNGADLPPDAADAAGPRPLGELAATGPPVPVELDPLAPAMMLFTSGSTGVPKACELSHHYLVRAGQIHAKYLDLRPSDVLFTPFPLFHIDAATLTIGAALAVGATAALSPRFSASRFWDEVRACDATVFNFMGATANILWKQPPSSGDRNHQVRLAWGVPMPACEPGWSERFGFPLVEVYGLTDAGLPVYQPLDGPRRPGSCGKVISEYEVRIADTDDRAVAAGTVGEIQIRSDEPGLLMNSYFGMPEQTREAFRGGWFHTGDTGRLDADGHLYFVARSREVIRRRGEKIAAADVEGGVDACPAVRVSAAVGVPSELSEDDIKLFVVAQNPQDLTVQQIEEHCRRVLPRHMVPRYIEIVDKLPRTPTEKIERFKLAARSHTPATWDTDRHEFVAAGPAVDRKDLP